MVTEKFEPPVKSDNDQPRLDDPMQYTLDGDLRRPEETGNGRED